LSKGLWLLEPGEPVPDGFPLRLELVELGELTCEGGEEAIYVLDGAVEVDGRTCPAGGAVIVEGAARPMLTGPATVVRFSAVEPQGTGTDVHVVGPGGTWASIGEGRDSRYFADSTCEGCDLNLFWTGRDHEYVSAPHSHSADELIHVVVGEVHVGRRVLGPGSTIAVAKDQRYGFRSPGGFGFLNYRPHVATHTRDGVVMEEGPIAHGFDRVMDLR
jgi:hypothetical protein